jgi:hypothetical protein
MLGFEVRTALTRVVSKLSMVEELSRLNELAIETRSPKIGCEPLGKRKHGRAELERSR